MSGVKNHLGPNSFYLLRMCIVKAATDANTPLYTCSAAVIRENLLFLTLAKCDTSRRARRNLCFIKIMHSS